MAMQARERRSRLPFARLDLHHLKHMQSELKRVMVLLAEGFSREEIARDLAVSPSTIDRWITTATGQMMVCLEEEHANHGELRGYWIAGHLSCCLEPGETPAAG